MKAYVIAVENIHNEDMFAQYRAKVMPLIEAFGGRFLVRGGRMTEMEGAWPRRRTVVIEFPSREKAEGWYASPEYQKILPLRTDASDGELIIIDGVA